MAAPPAGQIGGNVFDLIVADHELQAKVNNLVARVTRTPGVAHEETDLAEHDLDSKQLKSLMLTYVNGASDMAEQRIAVEYLKSDQKMRIPYSMAMLPYASEDPEVAMHETLSPRYWRSTQVPYAQMKTMLMEDRTPAQVRAYLATVALPPAETMTSLFVWPTVFLDEEDNAENPSAAAITFGYWSNCLQFNCDIRDVGMLTHEANRMADDAWLTIADKDSNHFAVRIQPFTMQIIAALNYECCGSSSMAGWVRSYGVGTGCLPTRDSKLQKEYYFTCAPPTKALRATVTEFEEKQEEHLYPIAMNLLALFGLFHLAKDHTFRTGDANMDRIGISYLMTLRTMVHSSLMDDIRAHQEALVRTAQHPFGLGQTYAIALHMYKYQRLATPLRLRITATPPPVQRLFIVIAAKDEWAIMPIGPMITGIFGPLLDTIRDETHNVLKNAPSYSGLHELYGVPAQVEPGDEAMKAASALLPVVYGYAMVQHSDSNNKKEGIALALSLQNVALHHKTMSTQWQRLWEAYIEKSDKDGLEKFLRTAYASASE